MKTSSILDTYQTWLTHREYSPATIQKYTKALARFFADTGAGDIPTRETVAAWRDSLTEKGYTPATVNAMLAAVNDCQESIDNVAGNVLTAKISASPSQETACTLSDILMSDVEEKYFLSPKQQEVLLFKPTAVTKGSASTPPKD